MAEGRQGGGEFGKQWHGWSPARDEGQAEEGGGASAISPTPAVGVLGGLPARKLQKSDK